MKSLVAALFVASSAIVPSLSFAQPTSGPTQAQTACAGQQGQMRQAQNSYTSSDKHSGMGCETSGSGAAMNGSAQAGAPMWQPANSTLFRHH
ncbi:DUF4148 domain-containing protein [Paraburkholderia tagetis]|uniref:DUF4148 domain-containing protein n=1 Tax=Paraburkholderia tagetis TaxID=2913261 RepID=A0A9X1UKZ5_9BURK|nr:DUF4148 domain-containing protein [Paraburkholderia tagetis]MCG5076706.1 DUF4148 domain-containing protein [Paraburkholderia tagetis]